ncbi:hypothetical protein EW145_g5358 [Phellinidium pouzarii]|uniref:Major facilitator superfamily (MFS) profile domain-containing protein n=1 Tax=Phellinidium pouzarii TaxID=167371 RepID=A0A4S4L0G7_9AGAM|nr:hypothetical protein EW145_g5358 [Phellinidium pouzarii]
MSSPSGGEETKRSSSEATAQTATPVVDEVKHQRGGTKDFGFLPIPERLQYDSTRPFEFTTVLNITFGFASTFSDYSRLPVANLYYCQPILIQLADAFNVTDGQVSRIPTLVQGGYATGLLLLSPLGDLVRRRPLLLLLVLASGALTVGLAVTQSLVAFEALTFLVGVFTVTPQILIPLAADLAPPHRRASAISIVLSGLLFGVLLARVLAGIIAEFASWRVVFYMSIGVQFLILALLYIVLPDWPAKNSGKVTYAGILFTMAKYAVTEPLLIQAGLMQFAASACFASFWVTLTFLLGGPPYHYSTLDIGRMIDRLVPWYATLVGTIIQIVFQAVQTGAGGINIAAVVISCFGIDVGRQMQQVSLTTAVYGISESSRARMNAVLIIWIFLGQVTGTAAGTRIFVRFGWRAAAAFSMGLYAWQIGILFLRGPHCKRYTWFGYEGGIGSRKEIVKEQKSQDKEAGVVEEKNEKSTEPDGEKVDANMTHSSDEPRQEKGDLEEVV